jgi:hypothetical protein
MAEQNLKKKNISSRSDQTKKRGKFLVIFALVAGGCLIIGAAVWRFSQNTSESAHISSQKPISRLKTYPADTQSDFNDLIGRWIRKDGGYVIEIRSIDAKGKMDAGYYNPQPINVSQAEAIGADAGIKLFIELQDVGYPGSTYTLIYNPQEDMMFGLYYQAAMGQNFDVVFVRTK